MPAGHPVIVLPALQYAFPRSLFVPPPQPAPAGWGAPWVPNLPDWQEGDVLLVGKKGLSGHLIGIGQSLLLPSGLANTHWSHCAIYAGGGKVVDAMPGKGVRTRPVEDFCAVRDVAILRMQVGGKLLHPSLGNQIAGAAIALSQLPYATSSLAAIAARFLTSCFGVAQKPVAPWVRKVYCSSLVVLAYREIGITLDHEPNVLPCMPANLQFHSSLFLRPVDWHELV
jgi:cell wall-associated NlpC family hydrolase